MRSGKNNKKNKRRMVSPCILTGIALLAAPAPFVYIRCAIKYNEPELIVSMSAKENTISNELETFSYFFRQKNQKQPEATVVSVINLRLNDSEQETKFEGKLCQTLVDSQGNVRVKINVSKLLGLAEDITTAKFDLVFLNEKANTKYTLTDFKLTFEDEPEPPTGDYENILNYSDEDVDVNITNPEVESNISYWTSKTKTWTELKEEQSYIHLDGGEKLCLRGLNPNGLNTKDRQLNIKLNFESTPSSGGIILYGSIMSLLDNGVESNEDRSTIPNEYCFYKLFAGSTSLYAVSDSSTQKFFPATNLKPHCYDSMFEGCTNLTIVPEDLPATNLVESCYERMFSGCTSLVMAPQLPSATAKRSYYEMFSGCTSLKVNNDGKMGTLFFTCPELTESDESVKDMFKDTAGTYTSDPVKDGKYYYGELIIPVESVDLNKGETTIEQGFTETLVATVKPDNAHDKSVTWSSSDETVATVDENGVVTGISPGTAIITVTTNDGGYTDTCTVTVTEPWSKVTSVEVSPKTVELDPEGTTTLTATVKPSTALVKDVTWSSSDENIATVDQDGKVTAIAVGSATITVTTVDGGFTDTCDVTVKQPITSHTVKFMVNGVQYSSVQVEDNTPVAKPDQDPVIKDQIFKHWGDPTSQYPEYYEYDFSTPVTSDLTINGYFEDNYLEYEDSPITTGNKSVKGFLDSTSNNRYNVKVPQRVILTDANGNDKTYTVDAISDMALAGTSGYKSIYSAKIAKTVKYIGYGAFEENWKLTDVTFEEGSLLETIDNLAFGKCGIWVEEGAETFNINLQDCTYLKSIGTQSFWADKLPTTFELPDSMTTIGHSSFIYTSGMNTVIIPSSMEEIGFAAFESSTNLTTVDLSKITDPTKLPSVWSYSSTKPSFTKPSSSNLTFLVANDEMLAAFQADTDWKTYTSDHGFIWKVKESL